MSKGAPRQMSDLEKRFAAFCEDLDKMLTDDKRKIESKLEILGVHFKASNAEDRKSFLDLLNRAPDTSSIEPRPIDIAVQKNSRDIVRFLMRNGAQFDLAALKHFPLSAVDKTAMEETIRKSQTIITNVVPSLCRMVESGVIPQEMQDAINSMLQKAANGSTKDRDDLLDMMHGVNESGQTPYSLLRASENPAIRDFAVNLRIRLNIPPFREVASKAVSEEIVPLARQMVEAGSIHPKMKEYIEEIVASAEAGSRDYNDGIITENSAKSQNDYDIFYKIVYDQSQGPSPFVMAMGSVNPEIKEFAESIKKRMETPEFTRAATSLEERQAKFVKKVIQHGEVEALEMIAQHLDSDKKWDEVFETAIASGRLPMLQKAIELRMKCENLRTSRDDLAYGAVNLEGGASDYMVEILEKARGEGKPQFGGRAQQYFKQYRDEDDLICGYKTWNKGSSLLHLACLYDKPGMVKFCIDALKRQGRNNDEVRNYDGDTPLHYAARHAQHKSVAVLLMQPTADVQNIRGETPMHVALTGITSTNRIEYLQDVLKTVALLLNNNPDLNVVDEKGRKPLQVLEESETLQPIAGQVKTMCEEHLKKRDTPLPRSSVFQRVVESLAEKRTKNQDQNSSAER